jgi:hypothetical protein
MPFEANVYKILVASPGDVEDEGLGRGHGLALLKAVKGALVVARPIERSQFAKRLTGL